MTVYILQRLREKDVERVSVQEEDSIVLSPQRRSFLTGCQATQVSRMLVLGTFLVQGGEPETLIYFTGLWIRVHMGPLNFFLFVSDPYPHIRIQEGKMKGIFLQCAPRPPNYNSGSQR